MAKKKNEFEDDTDALIKEYKKEEALKAKEAKETDSSNDLNKGLLDGDLVELKDDSIESIEKEEVNKKAEEKAELKRLKKASKEMSSENLVSTLKEQNNLKVYEVEDNDDEIIGEYSRKKEKETKLEKLKREVEIKNKVLENGENAYIQVVKNKRKTKKIIRYQTDINTGLSSEIVEYRVKQQLDNRSEKGSTKSIPSIIFGNIFTFFNIITFAIFIWLLSVGSYKDCVFMLVVTLNVSIGIFQEIRSKKVIDKLSVLSAPVAMVLRDSKEFEIPVNEVVLDDLLILESGKQICSDSIVTEGMIEVNESLLTGESDAIIKNPGDELFSGSFVVSGRCKARVDKVGKDNYIEKLTKAAKQYTKPKSDLLGTLNLIIRVMAILIIPIGALLFLTQVYDSSLNQFTEDYDIYAAAVIKTAGAMIGMIPSGLFLLTSVALYVGILKLSQNNTLVQELYCIEMLARVDCLCLDKTGTITDGTMKVKGIIEYSSNTGLSVENTISAMLNALNDSNLTSVALEEKFGRGKRIKHTALIPFSSARKWNAVEFEQHGTFVLGAPEFVLKDGYHKIGRDVEKSAAQGMRVLLLAHSSGHINETNVDGELTPVALVLIEDTIREDAISTIKYFRESGVNVKVISGDNPITVSKVAERAGIENAADFISLDGLTDKEVIRAANKYTVFGRVSPGQKKLLVKTLKSLGKTVAMTGDGVNDILALRESDCSIALASGSEAARNVSHLVLLDSNFGSMPKVVSEGRRVINNVQKVAALFLTKTIFSLLLSLVAIYNNGNYPISPSQLMIIELFVIGIPSFVLALEPNNSVVVGKFLLNVLRNALPGAITIMLTTLVVFFMVDSGTLILPEGTDVNLVKTTIIVINATFACFMVLLKVCRPFNMIRRSVFLLMSTCAIALVLFLPDFFEFTAFFQQSRLEGYSIMPVNAILLLLVLVQSDYVLMGIISNIIPWMRSLGEKILKLVGKI